MTSREAFRGLVWSIPPPARKILFDARKHADVPVLIPIGNGLLWIARAETLDFEVLTWEVEERTAVARIVKPGGVAIDLGAHCGLYTLLLSRLVGPVGKVLAFEPSPRELPHLRRHIRLNGCANVKVEPIAIGNSKGTASLYLSGGTRHTGNNSLRPSPGHPHRVEVPLTRLDEYVSSFGEYANPTFIKMDIEGGELDALRGAEETIRRAHPAILIEMSEPACESWGYRCVEKYDLLTEWGYELYSVAFSPFPRVERFGTMDNLVALHESHG